MHVLPDLDIGVTCSELTSALRVDAAARSTYSNAGIAPAQQEIRPTHGYMGLGYHLKKKRRGFMRCA